MAKQKTRQECLQWLRDNPKVIAPQQKVTLDSFRPEDAEGVARLYHAVYGEGFAIDSVYDPDQIRKANEGPDLYQVVARTADGDIVGLSALFRVSSGKGILESGGLMILPAYRLGTLALRLMDRTISLAGEELGLNATFGQCVTDHLMTQKLNRRFKAEEFAFELEAMPPRPEGGGQRISLLDTFIIFKDIPHAVHLPGRYDSFLRDCYSFMGVERRFLEGVDPTGVSKSELQCMGPASLAKAVFTEIGADFAAVVQGMEVVHPGLHVYQLQLPLSHPGLPAAVEQARELGYFIAGLMPLWTDKDVLLMQKVAGNPDFSSPVILMERGKMIVEFVREDRESLGV